jgi:hypothetical protein
MQRLQDKQRILKVTRENCLLTYKGKIIRITSELSAETIKARKAWNIFQIALVNNHGPSSLFPAKLSFKMDGKIKIFQHKHKLK